LFVLVYLCFFELRPYVLQLFLDSNVRGHAKCVAHGFRAALSNMQFLPRLAMSTRRKGTVTDVTNVLSSGVGNESERSVQRQSTTQLVEQGTRSGVSVMYMIESL
jgi:hypothetical protein